MATANASANAPANASAPETVDQKIYNLMMERQNLIELLSTTTGNKQLYIEKIALNIEEIAMNTVYFAAEKRIKGPDSSKKNPVLDHFILACHGLLPGVTVKAQWGDYLCFQAYKIVKDDPAL